MTALSVIVSAYNSASTIREAIESVLIQGVSGKAEGGSLRPEGGEEKNWDVEVIVVDDCSSDTTVEVVNSMIQEFSFRSPSFAFQAMAGRQVSSFSLHLVSLPRNAGPAAARNRGIAEAKGEWLAFLDADDSWAPDKLAVQTEYLSRNPDVVMVCGRTCGFEEDVKPQVLLRRGNAGQMNAGERRCSDSTRICLDDFISGNKVSTSTVLVKKAAVIEAGGFDERFRGPEDYDLWMRIAKKGVIHKMDIQLSRYRERIGSLSMDERLYLPQVNMVLDKVFGTAGVLSEYTAFRNTAVSSQYWSASWMAFKRGSRFAAIMCWWKAWSMNIRAEKSVSRKWFRQLVKYLIEQP